MPIVRYLPDERSIEVEECEFILAASQQAGVSHTHVCGGAARCSTCRVLVLEGQENCSSPEAAERDIAKRLRFPPNVRLACQTQVLGDITVRRLAIDGEDIDEINSQIRGKVMPELPGREKSIAILFADIRGFTSLSEQLLPYDIIYILNRYFRRVGEVVQRHGGQINNYMGDGFMALFGVNNSRDAADRAVRAGLEILEAVDRLNPHIETLYHHRLKIGIGIHYGCVVIGEVGTTDNPTLTAIGDAVNLASRIESANKELGTTMLISEATYREVSDRVSVKQCHHLSLKGKSGNYPLYEITAIDGPAVPFECPPIAPAKPQTGWQKLLAWLKKWRSRLRHWLGA